MLSDIKNAVNTFDANSLPKGMTSEKTLQNAENNVGFHQLEPIVSETSKQITASLKVILAFGKYYNQIRAKVAKIKEQREVAVDNAAKEEEKRNSFKDKLSDAKADLDKFKSDNKLSDSDIEKPLWGFQAILMMIGLTLVEMLISYISLSNYFDGYGTLLGVNVGLGLVSSYLAMLAGQFIKINMRIKKELHTYNNGLLTKSVSLPVWIEEHPSVSKKDKKYVLGTLFTNALIVCFILCSAIFTIIKFIVPLQDNNLMAYVIAGIVIFTNVIFFVAYEYFQYSGLTYQMRSKVDKKLKQVKDIEEKIAAFKSISSVAEVETQFQKQLDPIEAEYKKEFVKVESAQDKMKNLQESVAEISGIVSEFEGKLSSIDIFPDYSRLKDSLSIAEYPEYPTLF